MVTTSKNSWIVAIRSHQGNSYDGHKFKAAIEKAEEMTNWKAKYVYSGFSVIGVTIMMDRH